MGSATSVPARSDANSISKFLNARIHGIYKNGIGVCKPTWDYIFPLNVCPFSKTFFANLEIRDAVVSRYLRPHTRSRTLGNTRTNLLVHIIKYALAAGETGFSARKKLRALGRRHLISGITRDHMEVFAIILSETFMLIPCNKFSREDVFYSWTALLQNCIDEMYHEKINLVSHVHVDAAPYPLGVLKEDCSTKCVSSFERQVTNRTDATYSVCSPLDQKSKPDNSTSMNVH